MGEGVRLGVIYYACWLDRSRITQGFELLRNGKHSATEIFSRKVAEIRGRRMGPEVARKSLSCMNNTDQS